MARRTKAQIEADKLDEAVESGIEDAQADTPKPKTKTKTKAKATKAKAKAKKVEVADEDEVADDVADDDMGVATPTQDESKVQDGSDDGEPSELPKEEVDIQEPTTRPLEAPEAPEMTPSNKVQQRQDIDVINTITANADNVSESNLTQGVPIMDIPIRDLPGFGRGSKLDPKDPHSVRFARETLQRIRDIRGESDA